MLIYTIHCIYLYDYTYSYKEILLLCDTPASHIIIYSIGHAPTIGCTLPA